MSDHDRCEAEIRRLGAEVQASAARAIDEAKRYAADRDEWARDLAAARGITTRLREALLSGATDAAKTRSMKTAIDAVENVRHVSVLEIRTLGAAFLALHEEDKATRAELARLREQARVIGMGPAL